MAAKIGVRVILSVAQDLIAPLLNANPLLIIAPCNTAENVTWLNILQEYSMLLVSRYSAGCKQTVTDAASDTGGAFNLQFAVMKPCDLSA